MSSITRTKVVRPADYEEPYYWTAGAGFYQGKYPAWYDVSDSPLVKVLEDNYDAIKAEVLDFYEHRRDRLQPNWLQWGYTNEGWLTVDLMAAGMSHKQGCKDFPLLASLMCDRPETMAVQVAVLQPETRIRPHVGETGSVIRCHLPLVVPGKAPDLGMRVGAETRCWEEGKVFALNQVYRHYAWNNTKQARIIVVVDYINPDFADRQREIEARTLASTAMKGIASSWAPLKKLPPSVVRPIHTTVAALFRPLLYIQRRFGISWSTLVSLRPAGRRRGHAANDLPPVPGGAPSAG